MRISKCCHFYEDVRANTRVSARLLPWMTAGLMLPTVAFAHGEPHSGPAKFDYAKAEQKPFGIAIDPKKAARAVKVDMADNLRFTPSELRVKQGETVRFVVTNSGKAMHEMVLGTLEELKLHAQMMRKHPGMEHDEPHMAHVRPGSTTELGWRFSKGGTFYYGCLVAGHFEAGMMGKIVVE